MMGRDRLAFLVPSTAFPHHHTILTDALHSPLHPNHLLTRVPSIALSRVFNRLEVALELTQEDQESLKALRRLQELLRGGVGGGLEGDETLSPLPRGLPVSLPAGFSSFLPGAGGVALGPREVAEVARQAAGLATTIGPGAVAIVQKFLVQLTARSVRPFFYKHLNASQLFRASTPRLSGGGISVAAF